MTRKLKAGEYVDRYWWVVRECLMHVFGVAEAEALRECAAWQQDTDRRPIKWWSQVGFLYHDEPLYVAFDIAVRLGAAEEGTSPDDLAERSSFDYLAVRDRILSGEAEPAELRRAS